MATNKTIDILKEAILLERRGQAFYRTVAEQCKNSEVKTFFDTMAGEEGHHIEILESQFAAYVQNQQFEPLSSKDRDSQPAAQLVLTDAVKKQIAAADFEAAAISAAMLMEERAISLYSQRAETVQDPAEETLYLWLAAWERGHLSSLAQLDREIKESIWNDRQFWPF
jgi:rubrerythrin